MARLIQDKIKRPLAEEILFESWPSTAVWCISIFVTASRSSNSKPLPNWPDGRSTSARLCRAFSFVRCADGTR